MAKNPLIKTMNIFENNEGLSGIFKYNLFSHQIEYDRVPEWMIGVEINDPITDETICHLRYYIGQIHDFEPNKAVVGEACYLQAIRKKYHPVKDFIEKEKWDGENRLDDWIIKVTSCDDNIYTRAVSKNMMIAAVNRVYNPGCKFDHMVILEGPQNIGKSTMIEELSRKFYLDTSFDNKTNDLIDSMNQALIVEISELSGMNKREIQWVKSFITRKVDRVRLPYAARVKDFKRSCIFVGTHNPSGDNTYLRDDTGNRRFWPIECREIDIDYIRENISQLWAEAYERYKKKEIYHIRPSDKEILDILYGLHEDREFEGPDYHVIEEWLRKYPRESVTMEEIISEGLEINRGGKSNKEMSSTWAIVGIIMRKLRWRKGTGRNRRRYYAPKDFYSSKNIEDSEIQWDD